jgi:hypothetical protein
MRLDLGDCIFFAIVIVTFLVIAMPSAAKAQDDPVIAVQSWCELGRDLDRVREAVLNADHDNYLRVMDDPDSACWDTRLTGQPPLLGQQVTFHEQYPMNNNSMCLQFWLFVPHESYIGGVTTNRGLMLSGVTWTVLRGDCPLSPTFSSRPEFSV